MREKSASRAIHPTYDERGRPLVRNRIVGFLASITIVHHVDGTLLLPAASTTTE